jgi:PST family polysaccharide transporter
MAAVPSVVVLGLYGEKWAGAVALFQPLAIAIPLNALLALAGPVLSARGKPQIELRGQAITVVIAIIVYCIAIERSVLALSWAVPAVYLVRLCLLTGMALKEVGGRWRDLISTSWPGIILTIISVTIVRVTTTLLPPMGNPLRLLAVATSGAIGLILCLLLMSGWLLKPILLRAPQFAGMFPGIFRQLLPCEWRA